MMTVSCPIFIISGGLGASAEHVVRTALAQFERPDPPLVLVPHVRTIAQVEHVVSQAAALGSMIVHTLVEDELRATLIRLSEMQHVVALDLMGPLLDHLAAVFEERPLAQPGRYRHLHAASFS